MKRRHRVARSATSILIATLLVAPLGGGPAQAQSDTPDFSNVDDVLLGRRLVLPLQDVVLSVFGFDQNIILQTDQGDVTNAVGYLVQGTALSAASGRVFDLENDVIVTMVGTGSEAAALDVRDQLGNRTLQVPLAFTVCPPAEFCNPNIVVLGDLTGDGYDEIVIGYAGGGIQVASAADVTDFTQGWSSASCTRAATPRSCPCRRPRRSRSPT
jgi:hypothetical protein